MYTQRQNKSFELTKLDLQVKQFDATKLQYESNKALKDAVEANESQMIACLNFQQGCTELPDLIKNNFGVARGYLSMNALSTPKMAVDEKLLLTNINEYLLKKDRASSTREINGVLKKISVGEPETFADRIDFVPIQLTISFENKDGLLSFIDNVEKKVVPDLAYRVLYKIDKISYDIVDYSQPQDAEIYLYAYYQK